MPLSDIQYERDVDHIAGADRDQERSVAQSDPGHDAIPNTVVLTECSTVEAMKSWCKPYLGYRRAILVGLSAARVSRGVQFRASRRRRYVLAADYECFAQTATPCSTLGTKINVSVSSIRSVISAGDRTAA
jgi:hypothetical protein